METFLLNQPLLFLFVFIALSFFALVVCSRLLIDGSVALAHRFNISQLIIGTTIIGMGTSIDELIVNMSSINLPNASEIIMGNILGSNIVNLALGIGIPALITTIAATKGIVEKEIPIYLGLTALFTSFASDGQLTKNEGYIFIAIFFAMLFLIYQFSKKKNHHPDVLALHSKSHLKNQSVVKSLLQVFGGLTIMLASAKILVFAASGVALKLGVNSYIISLMIVGIGTSLPEIMASIQGAIKKNSDIVLGNVLGSNIFNLSFGLGLPMLFKSFSVNSQAMKDIYFLNILGIAIVFILLLDVRWLGHKEKINTIGGILLITGFLFFMSQKLMIF